MLRQTATRFQIVLLAAATAFRLSAAEAAPAPTVYNGAAYVTFGVGGCQHEVPVVNVMGGGHGFLWKGLALGGDVGYLRFVEHYGQGIVTGSVTIGYHFVNRRKPSRLEPFLNTSVLGIGVAPGGVTSAGSLGGGVNYWFRPRLALRTWGLRFDEGGYQRSALSLQLAGCPLRNHEDVPVTWPMECNDGSKPAPDKLRAES